MIPVKIYNIASERELREQGGLWNYTVNLVDKTITTDDTACFIKIKMPHLKDQIVRPTESLGISVDFYEQVREASSTPGMFNACYFGRKKPAISMKHAWDQIMKQTELTPTGRPSRKKTRLEVEDIVCPYEHFWKNVLTEPRP